ncbi:MAG: PTS sugar transporter subunit IIA [Planctomycetota bacterium]|jgi:mannitol/fructose-specific phosphotransferase system IIA component (Ntr-type)
MKPADLLDESRILLGIGSEVPKASVIHMLLAAALGDTGALRDSVAAELLKREDKMSTGIGRGVAIPHTRSAKVKEPVAALGVSPEGVDFGAVDEEPVRIIFTFITPESQRQLHLATLAEAVKLLGRKEIRDSIIGASNARQVIKALSVDGAGH